VILAGLLAYLLCYLPIPNNRHSGFEEYKPKKSWDDLQLREQLRILTEFPFKSFFRGGKLLTKIHREDSGNF